MSCVLKGLKRLYIYLVRFSLASCLAYVVGRIRVSDCVDFARQGRAGNHLLLLVMTIELSVVSVSDGLF